MTQPSPTQNKLVPPTTTATNSSSVLVVVVDNTKVAIPLEQIRHVDLLTTLTPLPFTLPPIDGLTRFNGRPLVQISLARAFGLQDHPGGKMVVMTVPQGEIAIRVHEVLGFKATGSMVTMADSNLSFAIDSLPVLRLAEILPWATESSGIPTTAAEPAKPKPPASATGKISVLAVASGNKVVNLLTDTIDHVEEIETLQVLKQPTPQVDLLIKIAMQLLPARSLSRLLGEPVGAERQAVIVKGKQGPWALAVERVLGLEKIGHLYSIPSSTESANLWYIADDGQIKEMVVWSLTKDGQVKVIKDANELTGETNQRVPITNTPPPGHQSFSQIADLSSEGLRVYCGKSMCMLPLALSRRVIDNLDAAMTGQRLAGRQRVTQIPFLDGTLLLASQPHQPQTHCNLLVSLPGQGSVVFAVDRALLQPTLPAHCWLPLSVLPPPASQFFDAATYDEDLGQWMLRVTTGIKFSQMPWSVKRVGIKFTQFPWAIKKMVSNAMLGWLDSNLILGDME